MEALTCMSIFCHRASDYESMFCLHCTLSSKYFSIERFELFKCVFLELSACILQRLTKRLNTVPVFIHNCCKHLNGGALTFRFTIFEHMPHDFGGGGSCGSTHQGDITSLQHLLVLTR